MFQKLLRKYDHCDPGRLYEIVSVDETRIKFTESTRKQQSKSWLPKIPTPRKGPSRLIYNIFDAYGSVAQVSVHKGGRMTGYFYA